jgi:hypothetical protein
VSTLSTSAPAFGGQATKEKSHKEKRAEVKSDGDTAPPFVSFSLRGLLATGKRKLCPTSPVHVHFKLNPHRSS